MTITTSHMRTYVGNHISRYRDHVGEILAKIWRYENVQKSSLVPDAVVDDILGPSVSRTLHQMIGRHPGYPVVNQAEPVMAR